MGFRGPLIRPWVSDFIARSHAVGLDVARVLACVEKAAAQIAKKGDVNKTTRAEGLASTKALGKEASKRITALRNEGVGWMAWEEEIVRRASRATDPKPAMAALLLEQKLQGTTWPKYEPYLSVLELEAWLEA
jgi:hypothetical protein